MGSRTKADFLTWTGSSAMWLPIWGWGGGWLEEEGKDGVPKAGSPGFTEPFAHSLFKSGISWGRVVALLGFGYRLALYVYQRGLTGFLGQVTCFLADIILHHYIARWIAQRGGWVAALNLRRDPILSVMVIFGVVLLGQFVVHRFFRS